MLDHRVVVALAVYCPKNCRKEAGMIAFFV